jgi:hypothetical protein
MSPIGRAGELYRSTLGTVCTQAERFFESRLLNYLSLSYSQLTLLGMNDQSLTSLRRRSGTGWVRPNVLTFTAQFSKPKHNLVQSGSNFPGGDKHVMTTSTARDKGEYDK